MENEDLLPVHNRKVSQQLKSTSRPSTPSLAPYEKVQSQSLPIHDRPQFILLVILYMLQGVPVGLGFGSIPFLLKSKLSYSQVATFSLASYPYSLKLLWSPIVDAIYSKRLGRRRSWIIPIQLVSGFTLLFLGNYMDQLFEEPEAHLSRITWIFFFLVFLCATQDIAVDGWALTILSPESLSYASTAQTIGLNTGYFLSFTVFLAFNSEQFSNKYLRSEPLPYGVLSMNQYLTFWGFTFIAVTAFVAFFVKEVPSHLNRVKKNELKISNKNKSKFEDVLDVYKSMSKVLKLPNIQVFILIHLISKIGFQANEGATNLKLLEKGFAKEDLAITVLIDFPFEILVGYYVARWSVGKNSLDPWLYAYLGRLFSATVAQALVYTFPKSGQVTNTYFILVILQHLFGCFMSTIQFVCINAFHTQISDPLIGGTYMTTLNTLSNLGGQWPRFIVLHLIDYFTIAFCEVGGNHDTKFNHSKEECAKHQGEYVVERDGYGYTNSLCILVGLVLFFGIIRGKMRQLQLLPISKWRVSD